VIKIFGRLYLGTTYEASQLPAANMSVTHVLNAAAETILDGNEFPGIEILNLKANDGQFLPLERFNRAMGFIKDSLAKQDNAVLICCGACLSRSPALTLAWLYRCGFGWDEAVNFLTHARQKELMIHPELIRSIREHLGIGQYVRRSNT
jgi:protein-tyrosine phosphatase